MKSGDKMILDFGGSNSFIDEVQHLNGTIVTLQRFFRTCFDEDAWYIEEDDTHWYLVEYFKPIKDNVSLSVIPDNNYCSCSIPKLINNYANGKSFLYCQLCKNERQGSG